MENKNLYHVIIGPHEESICDVFELTEEKYNFLKEIFTELSGDLTFINAPLFTIEELGVRDKDETKI